ncbi:MAG: HAD-IA family hydrolase [Candidatus Pacearchaeota archaeon]
MKQKVILVDAIGALVIEMGKGFGIFKEMKDLLDEFSNRKIILTMAKKGKQFKELGLDKMPWEVFTSEFDPKKTNPEYYRIMLNSFGLKPEEVIYFEHNLEAIKNAKSVGIKSYFYDNDKKDLVTLRKFLEDNL